MNLLLDTHAFLWHSVNDRRLGPEARDLIEDATNDVYLSMVSCWEMSIKVGLGKLRLGLTLAELLDIEPNGMKILDVSLQDVLSYSELDFPLKEHRDPFDRMIAVQARTHGLTLVTADPVFLSYLPSHQCMLLSS